MPVAKTASAATPGTIRMTPPREWGRPCIAVSFHFWLTAARVSRRDKTVILKNYPCSNGGAPALR